MPTIDGPRERQRTKDAELEAVRARADARPDRPPPRETAELPVYDDAHLQAYVKNASKAAKPTPPATPGAKDDDRVVYLGMNSDSAAAELRSLGALGLGVGHAAANDTARVGVRTFDLTKPSEAYAYAKALGLPELRARAIGDVIAAARPGSRDELAGIAAQWAAGLRSGSVPSRLMVSGHSDGDAIWGHDDVLRLSDLTALAKAWPEAAQHVQDLHLAGCNTAKNGVAPEERKLLREAFPNLLTFWGYQGASHLAPVGEIAVWDRATRGAATSITLTASLVDDGVTVADASGHVDGKYVRMSVPEFATDLAAAEHYFHAFFVGDDVGNPDPYQGMNLYNEYQLFQAALSRPEITDKPKYERLAQQALRLRYYEVGVRGAFQAAYRREIDAGYAALGRTPVDFAKLTRKDAVAEIADVLKSTSTDPAVLALQSKLVALRDLDPNVIDVSWCNHP